MVACDLRDFFYNNPFLNQKARYLHLALIYKACEGLKRAVPGFLNLIGKAAGRKLSHFQVIGQTIAAGTFPAAGFVSAIATIQVFVFTTFHMLPPSLYLFI
tara:strand:+ start:266 stop:568 length:303 start_codon:yes stop_codon:yes gene_type:complete